MSRRSWRPSMWKRRKSSARYVAPLTSLSDWVRTVHPRRLPRARQRLRQEARGLPVRQPLSEHTTQIPPVAVPGHLLGPCRGRPPRRHRPLHRPSGHRRARRHVPPCWVRRLRTPPLRPARPRAPPRLHAVRRLRSSRRPHAQARRGARAHGTRRFSHALCATRGRRSMATYIPSKHGMHRFVQ